MTDLSPQAQLVAAWEAWDDRPKDEHLVDLFQQACRRYADEHGLSPLFLRSEMARMRRRRPQPDRAAVLQAILEGTEQ